MKLDLSGNRAIVTGGARGIGRAISDALANAGAEVHAIDMNTPDDTGNIAFHQADITNISTVTQVVDGIGGPISILVNNAGITRDRTLMKMSDEE